MRLSHAGGWATGEARGGSIPQSGAVTDKQRSQRTKGQVNQCHLERELEFGANVVPGAMHKNEDFSDVLPIQGCFLHL